MRWPTALGLLLAAGVLFYGVLNFHQTTDAAPPRSGGKPPFANAVEQRMEMIRELQEIKKLLREQNTLLQSGGLKVVVVEPDP